VVAGRVQHKLSAAVAFLKLLRGNVMVDHASLLIAFLGRRFRVSTYYLALLLVLWQCRLSKGLVHTTGHFLGTLWTVHLDSRTEFIIVRGLVATIAGSTELKTRVCISAPAELFSCYP
jgi:hypothetical protein